LPASRAGSGDGLAVSSIGYVMQIVPQLHYLGKAVKYSSA
jgi:hypothetical protein